MLTNILSAAAYVIYIIISLALTLSLIWVIFERFQYRTKCTGDIIDGFVALAGIVILAFIFFGLLLFLYIYFKMAMFIVVILGLVVMAGYYFLLAGKGV